MNHLATAERLHALYLIDLCIDLEYELTGAVSASTIEQMRKVMSEVQSSTQKRGPELSAACSGEIVGVPAGFPQQIGCTGAWATP